MAYTQVTESPGQKATKEQLSMMITRYDLARIHSNNLDIIEIACGSGFGLGYLAKHAASVVGGDIDYELISIAKESNKNFKNVSIHQLDALSLPFDDDSFDVLIIFEAIYYLDDINKFIKESLRVLKPNGKIIISTVNCLWYAFNPSPYSIKYYTPYELLNLFKKENYIEYELLLGFYDYPTGLNLIKSTIKSIAVKFNLIPKTMEGKKYLKWVFYGKLFDIPKILNDEISSKYLLHNIKGIENKDYIYYKQLYLIIKLK